MFTKARSIIKIQFLLAITVLLIGTVACTDDSFDDTPFECTDVVSFKDDIVPMIITSCSISSDCHQVDFEYGDYTNYTGVKEDISKIKNRAIIMKNMPPFDSPGPKELSTQELNLLDCWISNGALDN